MEVAGVGGAVAEEAEHDSVAVLQLLGQRGAGGDGDVAADDAGGTQVALLHIGDVHGAAAAHAVAGGRPQSSAIILL